MKYFFLAMLSLASLTIQAQEPDSKWIFKRRLDAQKIVDGGEYLTRSGHRIRVGDTISLGLGTMPDKTFSYIFEHPSALTSDNRIDYTSSKLPSFYANRDLRIQRLFIAGARRSGFFILARVKVGGIGGYLIDIENAIASGELVKPGNGSAQTSIIPASGTIRKPVEELAKWKELLDDGAITPEEYEVQKKKILEM